MSFSNLDIAKRGPHVQSMSENILSVFCLGSVAEAHGGPETVCRQPPGLTVLGSEPSGKSSPLLVLKFQNKSTIQQKQQEYFFFDFYKIVVRFQI